MLLECDNGNFVMSEMLFPDCSKKESREKFWDILHPVVRRKLPKKEHIHEWREIMVEYDSWNCSIKYPIEKFLEELAAKENISWILGKFNGDENAAFAWLNEVIKFTFGELGSDAFENYSILPNQNGVFKKASELRRDNTLPIPSEIKSVYHIAFEQNVEDKLLNSSIEVTYVTSIKEYNLTSIIADLNGFIKDVNKQYNNRRDASYALTQFYSGENLKARREAMNYICSGFTPKVSTFTLLNNVSDDLWSESDRFLLCQIPHWIAESNKCTSLSMIGTAFLDRFENVDETKIIDWLNLYLKICTEMQCTSQLVNYAIFPNQKGNLKKIGELSYDNNIPEEIKDLSETANTEIRWRSSLLDRRIEGYSLHSPKNTSDIYRSISDTFDKSTQQLLIAKHAIALNYNNNPDISYIYSVMNKVYASMPIAKEISNAEGFDWEKFIACAIVAISGEIAAKINVKTLCSSLSTETHNYSSRECIDWVDKFLTFALNYRGGRYKTKVTELDNHGVWINQSEDFCMYSALSRDGGIAEPLKDLCANNPVVNINYRDMLIHNDSIMSSVIDCNKVITQNAVLIRIDDSLEAYKLNRQNPEFRSLIFGIMELDKHLHISEKMKYYKANKEKLIVGSLGEGDTMNMVAGIIQQGDEKIRMVKDLLEKNSIEELNELNKIITDDNVKNIVEKLGNMDEKTSQQLLELVQCDKTQLAAIREILKDYPSLDFNGILRKLKQEQGGFSTEQFQQNISDERKREIGDKGECFVYEMLCNRFGRSNVKWSNYVPNDENARVVRFGGKEYRLHTTSHDFDFVVSYNNKTIYVEVKTTSGNIKNSKNFPLIFEPKEWEWIDVNNEDDALHYIVRVFDVENSPKAYFLKQELNVD